jgi:hypothetical protein
VCSIVIHTRIGAIAKVTHEGGYEGYERELDETHLFAVRTKEKHLSLSQHRPFLGCS